MKAAKGRNPCVDAKEEEQVCLGITLKLLAPRVFGSLDQNGIIGE